MVNVTGNDGITWSFGLDKRMKGFLDKKVIQSINTKDKDYVLLIDGYEGAGKSTFAMQIGKYVDPNLTLDHVCFTSDEFKRAVSKTARKGQCVIYDEAVTGMAAAESITRVGRLLKSLMMQMRQKNLFVIIVLPSIFELNKYAVLSRARSFYHVYEKKGRMGYWVGYNKKDTRKTYLLGKKTHSYRVRSFFTGRFYGKYIVDEQLYRDKKSRALESVEDVEEGVHKSVHQRDFFIYQLFLKHKSAKSVFDLQKDDQYSISHNRLMEIVKKYKDKALKVALPPLNP